MKINLDTKINPEKDNEIVIAVDSTGIKLKSNGIYASKVKRKDYPTPDYQWNDVGIEITAVCYVKYTK